MRKWICVATVALVVMGCGSSMVGPDPDSDPEAVFETFWESYDRYYAHFEIKDLDWDAIYDEYRPQVDASTTDDELFEIMAQMLTYLQDGHVYLVGGDRRALSNTEIRASSTNFDRNLVRTQYVSEVNSSLDDDRITYGHIGESTGYIALSTLSGGYGRGENTTGWITEMERAVEVLSDSEAMILDLRNNGGGRAYNSKYVAGFFATERRPFLMTRSRSGPEHDEFSDPRTWYVEPIPDVHFDGPVVVLTNRRTFSAAEWLTIALRQYDHVVHMGTHSGGGLAMFLPRELPNGWMHTISVQDTRSIEGRTYERVGVGPHIHLENGADSSGDAMLDRALQYLEGP